MDVVEMDVTKVGVVKRGDQGGCGHYGFNQCGCGRSECMKIK